MDSNRLYFLALNRAMPLTPRERFVLWEIYGGASGSPAEIFRLSAAALGQLLGRRVLSNRWQPEIFIRQAGTELELAEQGKLKLVTYTDAGYPFMLKSIFDPPLVLYYRGCLPDWQIRFVAIVGTRHPTGAALTAAFRLGWGLSRQGIGIVSGLALGIDNEAHAGSLEGCGPGLAVLGNGIDHIYPTSSRPVARKLLEKGGCILSEYPPGTPPLKYNFPGRNRIISGLARTVVVIQAPRHSGALITADYALEQGRDLVVHKAGLTEPAGAGTRRLYEEGAEAIEKAEDVLERLPPIAHRAETVVNETRKAAVDGFSRNLFPDDYLTNKPDFVNLKEAGLILAKMLEWELKGEEEGDTGI